MVAVFQSLDRSVVKEKLRLRTKLSVYWSVYILFFSYCVVELWVVPKRIRT